MSSTKWHICLGTELFAFTYEAHGSILWLCFISLLKAGLPFGVNVSAQTQEMLWSPASVFVDLCLLRKEA